jgi:diguanylate cyclase (GGDEF)-like protein/PAS domain S-box-containing protein
MLFKAKLTASHRGGSNCARDISRFGALKIMSSKRTDERDIMSKGSRQTGTCRPSRGSRYALRLRKVPAVVLAIFFLVPSATLLVALDQSGIALAKLASWAGTHGLVMLCLASLGLTTGIVVARVMKRRALVAYAPYMELIDHAADAIVMVDPRTGRLLYVNATCRDRLGLAEEQTSKMTVSEIFVLEDSIEDTNTRFAGVQPAALNLRHRHMDGSEIDVEVRFSTPKLQGRPVWAYTTRDVSLQRKAEQQLIENQTRLDRIAHHDQLTGLPNRHYISAFLPGAIESAKTAGSIIGIVFIDLDRFKNINDTQGHETGDKLLQVVAQRLRECVRDNDVVVRMGGDEFVIIFRNIKSYEEVSRSANRIIESLSEPVIIEERQLQTSASVGISIYPRDGSNMMELLKHSDTAMYQAKDRGRNNVQIFDPIMNKKLKHRVTVEAMLREALREKQLEVHYQPFINLSTRKIVGLEALIRWRHPVRGMIPADWFIPVAEETGLVLPIGDFVLSRALQDMVAWRAAGASLVPVSLNVAASQLLRGDFRSKIAALLASQDIEPKYLQLEMTERAIFDVRAPQVGEKYRDTIGNLRDIGIKIAIDDFGTGYSSLAYLKNWQIDTLKIDKSFIRDLGTDSSDYAIVSAIIAIARHLHIEVIAEGVEAYQQADILRNLGCHQAQGYLFAKPMPAAKCLAMLGQARVMGYSDDDMLPTLALTAD